MDQHSPVIPTFTYHWQLNKAKREFPSFDLLMKNIQTMAQSSLVPHEWLLRGHIVDSKLKYRQIRAQLSNLGTDIKVELQEKSKFGNVYECTIQLLVATPTLLIEEKRLQQCRRRLQELANMLAEPGYETSYPKLKGVRPLGPDTTRTYLTSDFIEATHRMAPFYGVPVPRGVTMLVPIIKAAHQQPSQVLTFTPKKPSG